MTVWLAVTPPPKSMLQISPSCGVPVRPMRIELRAAVAVAAPAACTVSVALNGEVFVESLREITTRYGSLAVPAPALVIE